MISKRTFWDLYKGPIDVKMSLSDERENDDALIGKFVSNHVTKTGYLSFRKPFTKQNFWSLPVQSKGTKSCA